MVLLQKHQFRSEVVKLAEPTRTRVVYGLTGRAGKEVMIMTKNQIAYYDVREKQRNNRATEQLRAQELGENQRSNLAKEAETYRSNTTREAETSRSNKANEAINSRRNDITLSYNQYSLAEAKRHNQATEATDAARANASLITAQSGASLNTEKEKNLRQQNSTLETQRRINYATLSNLEAKTDEAKQATATSRASERLQNAKAQYEENTVQAKSASESIKAINSGLDLGTKVANILGGFIF